MTSRFHLPLADSAQINATGAVSPRPLVVVAEAGEPSQDLVETSDRLLQVGELAKLTGKTVRAIHHYEELGLLSPDARSKGRFRLYDTQALTRVRWISKLSDLGLSLSQVQTMLSAWEHAPTAGRAMTDVRDIYEDKLQETRAQIDRLRDLERELEASIAYLDTCETCADPPKRVDDESEREVAPCGACEHREREAEPELVAGIHSCTSQRSSAPKTRGHLSPVKSASPVKMASRK
jgi:MerR family transcriptional regulator, copper efflux regulator